MSEQKELTRGVIFPVFGRRGYYFAAYNAAFSIKQHNPDIKIAIFHDGQIDKELSYGFMPGVFDYKIQIPDDVLWHGGTMDPGYIKIKTIEFSPFDVTIQFDCEIQAFQDLNVIFDELEKDGGYFYSHVIGDHTIQQGNEIPSMYWAFANDIWNHFKLSQDAVLPSTNSSFQYWKKSPDADALHAQILRNYDYPIPVDRLRNVWGGTQPDELYLNVALAQKGITGKTPRVYLWMGNNSTDVRQDDVQKEYPIMCFFGTRAQTRPFFINWYDDNLIRWHSAKGLPHHLKYAYITDDKHANNNLIKPKKEQVYVDDVLIEMKHDEKCFLYLSFYIPEESRRREEILKALYENYLCDEIQKIFLITEQNLEAFEFPERINTVLNSDKVTIIHNQKRPTYLDCIKFANMVTSDNTITMIANADIYFDNRNVRMMKELNYIDTAYALSRWDLDSNGTPRHFNYEWSQDTWLFKGVIPEMDVDFIFGVPACDNRFAFEMKKNYRRVANPSYTIKTYHIHTSDVHNYTEANRLPGSVHAISAETIAPYRKRKLLMIQKGKVGDVLICLPIAKALSNEYLVHWLCPKEYHSLFDYVNYCVPVEVQSMEYDRTLDLSFGQGGAPESWWQREKFRFNSFVEAKYELAGIPVSERDHLSYNRNTALEDELYERIKVLTQGRPYAVLHESSDYGSPIKINTDLEKVYFKKVDTKFSIFDWRKVLANASEIHCIDSSLCNFVDVLPELKDTKKFYHKTDKVPAQYDETILNNNWERIDHFKKEKI